MYLDDILFYTETMDKHMKQVLKRLLDAKLYAKLSKCKFHKSSLDYLGYHVLCEGLEMEPGKVKSILEWQAPCTCKQLQSFLGFTKFTGNSSPPSS